MFKVNEIFRSIQGEGARAGSINVFVRFSGCNLQCNVADMGFDCDTEFSSGVEMTREDIFNRSMEIGSPCKNVIFTGGEPTLQLKPILVDTFKKAGWHVSIETNGTQSIEGLNIDFVSCSPKTAEHTVRVEKISEYRYVRAANQGIPRPQRKADHLFLSPVFTPEGIDQESLKTCLKLIENNPHWKLSLQTHKLLGMR